MPAYNFSHQPLLSKLENRTKFQTIRPLRKRPCKVGDQIYLFWKLRSKRSHRSLGEGVCNETFFITFTRLSSGDFMVCSYKTPNLFGATPLTRLEKESLAKRDGFESFKEMMETYFIPEYGDQITKTTFQVIRWKWLD